MWARLLLLGCSLEVAVDGSSHLRMKHQEILLIAAAAPSDVRNPNISTYCSCCSWLYEEFWFCLDLSQRCCCSCVAGSSTEAQRRCCGQGAKSPLKLVIQTSNDRAAPPSDPTHPTTAFKNWALFFPHVLKGEFPPFRALLGVPFSGS
jgi:hypothetical protein